MVEKTKFSDSNWEESFRYELSGVAGEGGEKWQWLSWIYGRENCLSSSWEHAGICTEHRRRREILFFTSSRRHVGRPVDKLLLVLAHFKTHKKLIVSKQASQKRGGKAIKRKINWKMNLQIFPPSPDRRFLVLRESLSTFLWFWMEFLHFILAFSAVERFKRSFTSFLGSSIILFTWYWMAYKIREQNLIVMRKKGVEAGFFSSWLLWIFFHCSPRLEFFGLTFLWLLYCRLKRLTSLERDNISENNSTRDKIAAWGLMMMS